MNFEKQLLEGNSTNNALEREDAKECSRARENEDESYSDDQDSSGSKSGPDNTPMTFQHREGSQTGVKGVIADYKHNTREQNRRHEEQKAASKAQYSAASRRNINDNGDRTLWTKEDLNKNTQRSEDELDDLDLEDEELVFEEYKQERLRQINESKRGISAKDMFGSLLAVSPDEYAEMVDQQAGSGVPIVVLLLRSDYASERLALFIRQLVADYNHAIFLSVSASECGFTDTEMVPIVLVYKNGRLEHNLVHVVDQLDDPVNFEQDDVKRLVEKILHK
ncbi:hypothetical protein H4217_004003 [Coemansia sp. RSA 1939]|nr:hypothetical protein H4217_004003 [Coemansia sp. RSA 1939]KAJ2611165.1 hypothetical protein EV177_003611 [Coemansia sp. RSA 1804]KAJ2654863.1 hypothetical protein GGH99_007261 [Coemansia sp. RSA 1285]